MDPFTAVLLASSVTSLSQLFKEQLKEQSNNIIGKKLMDKLQNKKISHLKIDEFKEILREILSENLSSPNEVDQQLDIMLNTIQGDLQTHSHSITELQSFVDSQFNEMMGRMDEAVALQFLEIKNELSRTLTVERDQKTSLMRSVKGMGAETVRKYSSFKDALVQLTEEFSKESIDEQLPRYGAIIDRNMDLKKVEKLNQNSITSIPIGGKKERKLYARETIEGIESHDYEKKFHGGLRERDFENYQIQMLNLMMYQTFYNLSINGGKFAFNKKQDPNDRQEMFYTELRFKKFNQTLENDGFAVTDVGSIKPIDRSFVNILRSYSGDFLHLLKSLERKEYREEFVKKVLEIFFKLTEKPAGSLVAVTDIVDDQFRSKIPGVQKENFAGILSTWILFLSKRGVELPTPFHFDIEAFEVKQDLIQKLTQV